MDLNNIDQSTKLFLNSSIINKHIFHKPSSSGDFVFMNMYVSEFLDFHFLLLDISTKNKILFPSQLLILPRKFTDKFQDKMWNKIIDEFFKIVQGMDTPIREGKPIGVIVGPVETRQKDGTIKVDPNSTKRQSHIIVGAPPINPDKYEKFLKKYF